MPFPDELSPTRLTRLFVGDEVDSLPIGTADIETKVTRLKPITEVQRDAITAKEGMMIFNDDTKTFQGYDGTQWLDTII